MEENNKSTVAEEDKTPEKQEESRSKRAVAFMKRHGLELVLGAGCIALSVVCIRQRNDGAFKDKIIALQGERIDNLVSLCEEKDAWFKKLMSDALKNGSSFAGKCMVDRREMLNGR